MNGVQHIVFLDGMLAGVCEDEYEIWDIADNVNNGIKTPLTDDSFADRVFWHTIDVNRYTVHSQTITDKITGKTILCYNPMSAKEGCKMLNDNELERERTEAKLRALAL